MVHFADQVVARSIIVCTARPSSASRYKGLGESVYIWISFVILETLLLFFFRFAKCKNVKIEKALQPSFFSKLTDITRQNFFEVARDQHCWSFLKLTIVNGLVRRALLRTLYLGHFEKKVLVIIGLQPNKTRAELDLSIIFETNILRVSPVNVESELMVYHVDLFRYYIL